MKDLLISKTGRPTVYFRADGNAGIGYGHVMRSLALAEMLHFHFHCVFVSAELDKGLQREVNKVCESIIMLPEGSVNEEGFSFIKKGDIIVLDGYEFDQSYQQRIKQQGGLLVCIDDLGQKDTLADVIINQAPLVRRDIYEPSNHACLCLGLDYALLRSPFLKAAKAERNVDTIQTAFVNFGGLDKDNTTLKMTLLLCNIPQIRNIILLVGGAYGHLDKLQNFIGNHREKNILLYYDLVPAQVCELLSDSDIAICAASSICIEAAAVGIRLACGYTAPNQMNIYNGVIETGLALPLGDLLAATDSFLLAELNKLIDFDTGRERVIRQKKLINGTSGERLLKVFENIALKNSN